MCWKNTVRSGTQGTSIGDTGGGGQCHLTSWESCCHVNTTMRRKSYSDRAHYQRSARLLFPAALQNTAVNRYSVIVASVLLRKGHTGVLCNASYTFSHCGYFLLHDLTFPGLSSLLNTARFAFSQWRTVLRGHWPTPVQEQSSPSRIIILTWRRRRQEQRYDILPWLSILIEWVRGERETFRINYLPQQIRFFGWKEKSKGAAAEKRLREQWCGRGWGGKEGKGDLSQLPFQQTPHLQ